VTKPFKVSKPKDHNSGRYVPHNGARRPAPVQGPPDFGMPDQRKQTPPAQDRKR